MHIYYSLGHKLIGTAIYYVQYKCTHKLYPLIWDVLILLIFYKDWSSLASKASLNLVRPYWAIQCKNFNLKPSHNLHKLTGEPKSDTKTSRQRMYLSQTRLGCCSTISLHGARVIQRSCKCSEFTINRWQQREGYFKMYPWESVEVKLHTLWPWKLYEKCITKGRSHGVAPIHQHKFTNLAAEQKITTAWFHHEQHENWKVGKYAKIMGPIWFSSYYDGRKDAFRTNLFMSLSEQYHASSYLELYGES
jgi:hypothetical protein